jgi:hypothetical protein
MVRKPKRLFLYLAIACFAGLVAIFIVDGYMGIYDTIHITVGEREEEIKASYWERSDVSWWLTASASEKISFSYRIDNNQLSEYSTHIEVSVWQENEKVIDLFSQDVSIARLDEATVEWILVKDDLGDTDLETSERTQYTIRINRGDVERRIKVDYYSPEVPLFPKPVPVR